MRARGIILAGALVAALVATTATAVVGEETFTVLAPRQGDRATFEVTAADGSVQLVEVERLPARRFVAADGHEDQAVPLRVAGETTHWVTSAAGEAMAVIHSAADGDLVRFRVDFDAAVPHCLAATEQTVLPRGADLPTSCWLGGETLHLADGRVTLQGRRARLTTPDATVTWDLASSFPSEVQTANQHWVRVAQQRGAWPMPRSERTEPLLAAAPVPWVVNDASLDHPFHLSTAYTWATIDPVFAQYQAWNQTQSATRLVHADLTVTALPYGAEASWTLVVQGSDSYATLRPRAIITGAQAAPYPMESTTLLDPARTATINAGNWPDGIGAPAAAPGMDRLERGWQALLGVPVPVSGWSIAPCACPAQVDEVRLRHDAAEWAALAGPSPPRAITAAWLAVGLDGQLRAAEVTAPAEWLTVRPQGSGPAALATESTAGPAREHWGARESIWAAVSLATALAWLRFGAPAPLAGLFARRAGEPKARRDVLDLVAARPGIHHSELVRASGLANGTVSHHVRVLVKTGLVEARRDGRYLCYGAVGSAGVPEPSALKAAGARRIVQVLREQGPLDAATLRQATGLSRSTVSYHVRRLRDAGALARGPDGRFHQA